MVLVSSYGFSFISSRSVATASNRDLQLKVNKMFYTSHLICYHNDHVHSYSMSCQIYTIQMDIQYPKNPNPIRYTLNLPHLPRNSITKLNLNPGPHQHMNPKPLRITQPIIRTLDLNKANLPRIHPPEKQIRDTAAPRLVLLRHDLANSSKRFAAEAVCDFDEIVQCKGPV